MESNEGIIDAEASVQQRLEESDEHGSGLHRAEHAALIARGGFFHSTHDDDSEQTPLLARQGNGAATGEGGNPAEAQKEEDWPGAGDFDHLPWWRRPSMYWILAPFLLFTIAFGGTIIPKVNLIQDILCRDYYMDLAYKNPDISYTPILFGQDDSRCTAPVIEKRAASFLASGSLISGLLSVVTSPKLGELSDYYGRKTIMIVTVCCSIVLEALTVCAALYTQTFNVYWLYVGWFFEGLGGSFIAGMALSNAYGADTTAPSQRNVAFGYFHGVLFSGIALGPVLASEMIRITGSLASVFIFALLCHCLFVFFLVFIIPESLSPRRQLAAREKRARRKSEDGVSHHGNVATKLMYSLAAVFRPLKTLYPRGPGSSMALRRNLVILAAIDFTVFGVAMGALSVVTIYIRKQFNWDVARQGEFVSIVNTSRVLVLVLVLPLLNKIFRGRTKDQSAARHKGCDTLDLNLIRVAIALDTLGFLGYTFARDPMLFTFSGVVAAMGGMASPTLQSSLTKHIPQDRTGQLLGATGLLHAIGRIISPLIFNGIFAATNDKFRQTVFLCLALAFGVALFLAFFLKTHIYLDEVDETDVVNDGAS